MAQFLPTEVLLHIVSFISPTDYLKNGLINVCSDWHDLEKYEMFWLHTLKSLLNEQIQFSEHEHDAYLGIDNENYSIFHDVLNLKNERISYIKQLKQQEKILIVNREPFQNRRETNDDIFGQTYKRSTCQFVIERRKRLILLEIIRKVLKRETNFEMSVWRDIVNSIRNNPFCDLKSICKWTYSDVNLPKLFLVDFKSFCRNKTDLDVYEFLVNMLNFFCNECESQILDLIDDILHLKQYRIFSEPSLGLFEKFKKEVNGSGKSKLSSSFLLNLMKCADHYTAHDMDVVTKFIDFLKDKKLIKFREKMLSPYVNNIAETVRISHISFELFFKGLEPIKCPKFSPIKFVQHILNHTGGFKGAEVVEVLRRAHKEYGLDINFIPRNLLDGTSFAVFQFFVEENGVDINQPIGDSLLLNSIVGGLNGRSRTEEILLLMDKGAIMPETSNNPRYTTQNIFNFYLDGEDLYLSTLKKLTEMYGPRFTDLDYFSSKNLSRDMVPFSLEGLISVIDFFYSFVGEAINTQTFINNMYRYQCSHLVYHYLPEELKEFRTTIREKYGIILDE